MTEFMDSAISPENLEKTQKLRSFLQTATDNWQDDKVINSYPISSSEYISCVRFKSRFFITGTDIVRTLLYRFELFGRPVQNLKKFEEGVFSDLRNLKPGTQDATLEEPRSDFLELLYKNNCIRTQKKQKVFNWFSVNHDRLFMDALERDLKRETMKLETTTKIENPDNAPTLELARKICTPFAYNIPPELLAEKQPLSPANTESAGSPSPKPVRPRRSKQKRTLVVPEDSDSSVNSSSSFKSDDDDESDLEMDSDESEDWKAATLRMTRSSRRHSATQRIPLKSNKVTKATHKEKLYLCSYADCGRQFKRPEHLQRHIRCHSGTKPYRCPTDRCSKGFKNPENLAVHLKSHTFSPSPQTSSSVTYTDSIHVIPQPQQIIPPTMSLSPPGLVAFSPAHSISPPVMAMNSPQFHDIKVEAPVYATVPIGQQIPMTSASDPYLYVPQYEYQQANFTPLHLPQQTQPIEHFSNSVQQYTPIYYSQPIPSPQVFIIPDPVEFPLVKPEPLDFPIGAPFSIEFITPSTTELSFSVDYNTAPSEVLDIEGFNPFGVLDTGFDIAEGLTSF
ncbi:homeodomain transcription factor ste12 [Nowakowskiella sp. JEL0407]|nr:homeodomain transcription factor ste12 [Nowakowskiella sp. JEL0407]